MSKSPSLEVTGPPPRSMTPEKPPATRTSPAVPVRGQNYGTLDFGSGALTSMAGDDGLFVAKRAD
jgi:hypothetical protein